jgi:hypothetical protein
MEEHETRRKLIREWMKLPKDRRRTEEQVAAYKALPARVNADCTLQVCFAPDVCN